MCDLCYIENVECLKKMRQAQREAREAREWATRLKHKARRLMDAETTKGEMESDKAAAWADFWTEES